MGFTTGIYCHCLNSKVNTDFYLYKDTGDKDLGQNIPKNYYNTLAEAQAAMCVHDTDLLPIFLPPEMVVFYTDTSTSSTPTYSALSFATGTQASDGYYDSHSEFTKIPCCDVTNDTSDDTINNAKGSKLETQRVYRKADKITIKKPIGYSDFEFKTLLSNINNYFEINLPLSLETSWVEFIYNKVTYKWEKIS